MNCIVKPNKLSNPFKNKLKYLNVVTLKLQCWWLMCACLTTLLRSLPGPTWRLSTGDHKVDQCSSWMMEADLSHHTAWLHLSTWPHESLNLCGHILRGTLQKRTTKQDDLPPAISELCKHTYRVWCWKKQNCDYSSLLDSRITWGNWEKCKEP